MAVAAHERVGIRDISQIYAVIDDCERQLLAGFRAREPWEELVRYDMDVLRTWVHNNQSQMSLSEMAFQIDRFVQSTLRANDYDRETLQR